MANYEEVFKKLVAHAKEYGFIFQSSELYDGLGAVYDYGPNGVELKNNIRNYWWKSMVSGGVSKAGSWITNSAREIVRKHMMAPYQEDFELMVEDLGNDSALLGAAGLAFNSFG
mgnify:CR=1 FL=1